MHRIAPIPCIMAVFLSSGCQLAANAYRNAVNEPMLAWEAHRHHARARWFARKAWESLADAACQSRDFRDGYLDGYADFLESGGDPLPPSAPPSRYQRIAVHTPETLRAIEDYFAGFQRGAEDAQRSGQRKLLLVPVAMPLPTAAPATGSDLPQRPVEPPAVEPLPPPREAVGIVPTSS